MISWCCLGNIYKTIYKPYTLQFFLIITATLQKVKVSDLRSVIKINPETEPKLYLTHLNHLNSIIGLCLCAWNTLCFLHTNITGVRGILSKPNVILTISDSHAMHTTCSSHRLKHLAESLSCQRAVFPGESFILHSYSDWIKCSESLWSQNYVSRSV